MLVYVSLSIAFLILLFKYSITGSALEMKSWLRITFAVEPSSLKLGLERLKSFCQRHEKK
jgi:hypothetical protein